MKCSLMLYGTRYLPYYHYGLSFFTDQVDIGEKNIDQETKLPKTWYKSNCKITGTVPVLVITYSTGTVPVLL
jgi:hypothetical protein